jgi:hypothetical protein
MSGTPAQITAWAWSQPIASPSSTVADDRRLLQQTQKDALRGGGLALTSMRYMRV